jgi:hypothetical protein
MWELSIYISTLPVATIYDSIGSYRGMLYVWIYKLNFFLQ